MLKNSHEQYGLVTKMLHWLSAFAIIGLYILGKWMEDLDYYHEWYRTAPDWHKSIGILLIIATLLRLIWKFTTPSPEPIKTHSKQVQWLSQMGHKLIYLCLIIALVSGYLISTADGRAIMVFNWFSVPSMGELFAKQEDIAGEIHEQATNALILLAIIHVLAAFKHHFFDRDNTLKRMLK